jgi:hypothetical protein
MEELMEDKSFGNPVFVRTGERLVQEIASVHDALDFLDEWPENLRGSIYETALRACYRAHDGLFAVGVARSAFEGFAKSARILEEVSAPLPWMMQDSKSGQGGVTAYPDRLRGRR